MQFIESINEDNINDVMKSIIATRRASKRISEDEIVDLTLNLLTSMNLLAFPEADKAPHEQRTAEPLVPAVPVEDSVQADYIVCLEDGQRFSMMKRHLRERYGLTPDQYRNKWGLPKNYPMTAPSYSEAKARYARGSGLGKYDRGNGLH